MNNQRIHSSSRVLVLGLVAIILFLGIGLSSLSYAQTTDYKNVIRVNNLSDEDKKNDGFCTLRESIIVANKGQASTGKPGECDIENIDPNTNGFTILLPSGYYSLFRTDNGNEDSSTTGDLDLDANSNYVHIVGCEPDPDPAPGDPYQCALPYETHQVPLHVPVVISGDEITDRVIHILSGDVTIENVTIRGGNVSDFGGGIYNQGGTLNLINATLTQNKVNGGGVGGGLANASGATSTLTHVTISDNIAPSGSGSGLATLGGALDIRNSLIFDDECYGIVGSANHTNNLAYLDGGTCDNLAALNDNPNLVPINTDGGEIDTATCDETTENCIVAYFELGEGSAAIDNGDNTVCDDPLLALTTDQVFRDRKQGSACDIGSYEADEIPHPPAASNQELSVAEDGQITFALSVSDPNNDLDWSTLIISGPSLGTLTGPDDLFQFTYTPSPHFSGDDDGDYDDDWFTYSIDDKARLGPASAKVSFEITPNDDYIEVTNVCDSGLGSLRDALTRANSTPASDIIIFDILSEDDTPPGLTYCGTDTIELETALPPITAPVMIDGLAAEGDSPLPFSGGTPNIILDGVDGQCTEFSGFTILNSGSNSTIANLIIRNMGGSGIVIGGYDFENGQTIPSSGNSIVGNVIYNNGCADPGLTIPVNYLDGDEQLQYTALLDDGVTVLLGLENAVIGNDLYGNTGEPVDLGGDGPTANDTDDLDGGPNFKQNYPVLFTAVHPGGIANLPKGEIEGLLNSKPSDPNDPNVGDQYFTLQFFMSQTCESDNLQPLTVSYRDTEIDEVGRVKTDGNGDVSFTAVVEAPPELIKDHYIFATATDKSGNTSEYTRCLKIGDGNNVWPRAEDMQNHLLNNNLLAVTTMETSAVGEVETFEISQTISEFGGSTWYKFVVEPDSTITLDLTDLSVNYDLTMYKDIGAAFTDMISTAVPDLDVIGAEFAADAFAPQALAPQALAPQALAPQALAPQALAPLGFAPQALAPQALAPQALAPQALAPQALAPEGFAPQALAPQALADLGDMYSSAQIVTLIGISAFDGTAPERLVLNTFNNSGTYYARVTGRQGAFDPTSPFTFKVTRETGVCSNLDTTIEAPSVPIDANNYETLILIDETRLGDPTRYPNQVGPGTPLDIALNDPENSLAAKTNGKVVNVGQVGSQVYLKNQQADLNPACVTAKNIVAEQIKAIVTAYREANPNLKYLVIVGNDDIIPFFRYPDLANIGPEEDYVPPLDPTTTSDKALRANYYLSQDEYGSSVEVSFKDDELPLPDLGIGRLVEEPSDMVTVINAFLSLNQAPEAYTVTLDGDDLALSVGYDFMVDTAEAIRDVFKGTNTPGPYEPLTGLQVNQLISQDWTAPLLVNLLQDTTEDPKIAFLAGHYAGNSAVAADYQTYFYPQDVLDSPQDFTNNFFFGNGCHLGYNIVNEHDLDWTLDPDWAQAFASRGASLIAGTGYQYGDTDFIEYNERLYLELAIALRNGNAGGSISLGDALNKAKKEYLKDTPLMRGIHQKALLQATLFGLPMLRFDLPGGPVSETPNPSLASNPSPIAGNPGLFFDLHTVDVVRNYVNPDLGSPPYVGILGEVSDTFDNIEGGTVAVSYLTGPKGDILRNVGEPILPLDEVNVTNDLVLRGVGFMGGSYRDFIAEDETGDYVWMGSATTEVSAAHFNFISSIFYPPTPWSINRYDAITETGGETLLNIIPEQIKADLPLPHYTTRRRYDEIQFRLFYSDFDGSDPNKNTGLNLPALAMPPSVISAKGLVDDSDNVTFELRVTGDPSAGIQAVWVTYTTVSSPLPSGNGGKWVSLIDLVQDPSDSTIWSKTYSIADLTSLLSVPPTTPPSDLRFIAQACTGTGLCSLSDNFGRYYTPGANDEGVATSLSNLQEQGCNEGFCSGPVGSEVTFSADLSSSIAPLEDLISKPIYFSVGQERRFNKTEAVFDENGAVIAARATVTIPLLSEPGDYLVSAWFPGDTQFASSSASSYPDTFTIEAQDTILTLQPSTPEQPAYDLINSLDPDVSMYAELKDADGKPLGEKTVIFTIEGGGHTIKKAVITDQEGHAPIGKLILPELTLYSVNAEFKATSSFNRSTTETPGKLDYVIVKAKAGGNTWEETIWPTNNKLVDIRMVLASGGSLDNVKYKFIEQDEEVKGDPDAVFPDDPLCTTAQVRAERDGNGNGRVYHVVFYYEYPAGSIQEGEAYIATIPHDQSGDTQSVNNGTIYPSASCSNQEPPTP